MLVEQAIDAAKRGEDNDSVAVAAPSSTLLLLLIFFPEEALSLQR